MQGVQVVDVTAGIEAQTRPGATASKQQSTERRDRDDGDQEYKAG